MGNFRCKLCQRVGFKGFSRGFFKFPTLPKRQKIRDQWLKVCELTADTDTRKLKICFRHFNSSEIEEYDNYLRINPCKTFPYLKLIFWERTILDLAGWKGLLLCFLC